LSNLPQPEIANEVENFFDLLGLDLPSQGKPDRFDHKHLMEVYLQRVAKSQATGKDGIRVGKFAEKLEEECLLIEGRFKSGGYRFTNYKERLILRGADREPRQISIPTVRDRLTLRSLCEELHSEASHSSGRSPHSLVHEVVAEIRKPGPDRSFVRIDVKNFFPSIIHKQLEKELLASKLKDNIIALCMQAVATPTGASKTANPRGVPQGLSVSNALSAIYLHRFDVVQSKVHQSYFRYVDDILVITETAKASKVLEQITVSLNRKGLRVHKIGTEGKTEIRPIAEGIDFLGYHICIEKVSVRKSSFQRMFKNCMKLITDYRYRKNIEKLKFRLNLKITGCIIDGKRRGWTMFFAQTENMSQLAFLDQFVRSQLKRVGLPAEQFPGIKTFIKSHHEIRFNLENSQYIPNFDNYDLEDMTKVVSALTGEDIAIIATWDSSSIIEKFNRLISKEVQDLEQDVGNPS
jgi:RNA-directed DNA polymerase